MRPASVCWCPHLPRLETKTRVVLLQHPREERVPIGTARMAALALEGAQLFVGTELDADPGVRRALDDPERPAVLLWPGAGARDLATDPPRGPVTLVVVDGTWSLAKKLVRINPRIAALPRYALEPAAPSEYRIRREPSLACVSTVEAVMYALGILEGDPDRFRSMLAPFRAMVDAQIEHADRLQGGRARKRKGIVPKPRIPAAITDGRSIVVVHGEANAWPFLREDGRPRHPDELVQWVAVRLDTGERFEMLVAPEYPLSPSTTLHTRLAERSMLEGQSMDRLHSEWRAFLREGDVIAGWGYYAAGLFAKKGGFLPPGYCDIRAATTRWLRAKPGSLEGLAERIGASFEASEGGRGVERMLMCAAVVRWLRAAAVAG
jgi:DTW domain-containing protein YfiP